jgi:hypothetical protein
MGQESKPFVISSSGEIDFGTAYDLQQYGRTDFPQRSIEIGCRFGWDAHGEDDLYEVASIIAPGNVADNVAATGQRGFVLKNTLTP